MNAVTFYSRCCNGDEDSTISGSGVREYFRSFYLSVKRQSGVPRPAPLTAQEIQTALEKLPNWEVVESSPPASEHELHRLFEFSSFPDAMHFMLTASRFIQVTDHHPSWRNTYSKLEVWITTGELKHQLSAKDVTLAAYLEELFRAYETR